MIKSNRPEGEEKIPELIEFEKKLKKFGVKTNLYGKGNARSIEDLYWEVHRGEASMGHHDGKFKRLISVLRVEIWASTSEGDKMLVHTDERLEDQRVRKGLNERLAKKLSHDETVEDALNRALATELVLDGRWQMKHLKLERMDEALSEKESLGCPGILTIYHFHNIYMRVIDPTHEDCMKIGLPKGEGFTTSEITMLQERSHRWKWFTKDEFTNLANEQSCVDNVVTRRGDEILYFHAVFLNFHEQRRDSAESLDSVDSADDKPQEVRSAKPLGGLESSVNRGENAYLIIKRNETPFKPVSLMDNKLVLVGFPVLTALIALLCCMLIQYFEESNTPNVPSP